MRRDFIQASVLEMEGRQEEALAAFRKLDHLTKTRGYNGRIVERVESAIMRISGENPKLTRKLRSRR